MARQPAAKRGAAGDDGGSEGTRAVGVSAVTQAACENFNRNGSDMQSASHNITLSRQKLVSQVGR
jgi:hypothetical protein